MTIRKPRWTKEPPIERRAGPLCESKLRDHLVGIAWLWLCMALVVALGTLVYAASVILYVLFT